MKVGDVVIRSAKLDKTRQTAPTIPNVPAKGLMLGQK